MVLNIQVLRGLAALLVVFVHLQDLAQLGGAQANVFIWGNSGVDLFFVISGLIMVQTTSRGPVSATGFLRNRLTRVAPLYWAITLVVFALACLWPQLFKSTDANPVQLLMSLAFIPYVRPDGAMHPIVFLGWTLNYEMAFYLLFAAGLLVRNRLLSLALPIVVLAVAVGGGLLLRPSSPVTGFYTAPIVLEFAAGMVLGAILLRLPETPRAGAAAMIVAAGAFALMIMANGLFPRVDRAIAEGLPATAVVAAMVVAEKAGLVLRLPILRRIGDASYSIYLTHFFVTGFVTRFAAHFALRTPIPLALSMLGALVLVVLVGLASHAWIEMPMTRFVRGGFRWAGSRTGPIGPATAKQ